MGWRNGGPGETRPGRRMHPLTGTWPWSCRRTQRIVTVHADPGGVYLHGPGQFSVLPPRRGW